MTPLAKREFAQVGTSNTPDGKAAGKEAAAMALEGMQNPALLVCFASGSYEPGGMVKAIRAEAPRVPLVGCSTLGEITSEGPTERSVVIMAFGGDQLRVAVGSAEEATADPRKASAKAAEQAIAADFDDDGAHRSYLMFADVQYGDRRQLVAGAYDALGATAIMAGGVSADVECSMPGSPFFADRVLDDSVVGAMITSESPIGVAASSPWSELSELALVTRAKGNVVFELDGQPARDVYLDLLGKADQDLTAAQFDEVASNHPLGIVPLHGKHIPRRILGATPEGGLRLSTEAYEHTMTTVMSSDAEAIVQASVRAANEATGALDGVQPRALLLFGCAGLRKLLGDDAGREVEEVAKAVGPGVPIAGCYTGGEISRSQGIANYHNLTLVALAFA